MCDTVSELTGVAKGDVGESVISTIVALYKKCALAKAAQTLCGTTTQHGTIVLPLTELDSSLCL